MTSLNIELARHNMVEQQIRPWEVADPRVLELLARAPREDYVPTAYRNLAYADLNIPLPHGEVMMAPKIEARLLQALELGPRDKVLEVGTGSGYLTSLLAALAGHVVSVEIHEDLSGEAARRLAAHGVTNVTLEVGDAAGGWGRHAPYDAIVLTGSVPTLPDALRANLAPGGRLFAIVGESPVMSARLVRRLDNGQWIETALFETDLPALANHGPAPRFVF
jgi:protein-L-isoaspartate(D-aspartate) O-methyltransferase